MKNKRHVKFVSGCDLYPVNHSLAAQTHTHSNALVQPSFELLALHRSRP